MQRGVSEVVYHFEQSRTDLIRESIDEGEGSYKTKRRNGGITFVIPRTSWRSPDLQHEKNSLWSSSEMFAIFNWKIFKKFFFKFLDFFLEIVCWFIEKSYLHVQNEDDCRECAVHRDVTLYGHAYSQREIININLFFTSQSPSLSI